MNILELCFEIQLSELEADSSLGEVVRWGQSCLSSRADFPVLTGAAPSLCPEEGPGEGPGEAGLTRLCSARLTLLALWPVNSRCELGSP